MARLILNNLSKDLVKELARWYNESGDESAAAWCEEYNMVLPEMLNLECEGEDAIINFGPTA